MRKTRKERRREFIQNVLSAIVIMALMAAIGFMFLNAWAEEKPITLHDHLEDFKLWHAYENCPTLRY